MNKKLLSIIALLAYSFVNSSEIGLQSVGHKTRYIVRTDTDSISTSYLPYNKLIERIRVDLKRKNITEKEQKALITRLAIMTYINKRVIKCFAERIAGKTELNKDALKDLESQSQASQFIEKEYERNFATTPEEFTAFKNANLDISKLESLIEQLLPCGYLAELIVQKRSAQIPMLGRLFAPYFIQVGKLPLTINKYLALVEEALQIVFTDAPVAKDPTEFEKEFSSFIDDIRKSRVKGKEDLVAGFTDLKTNFSKILEPELLKKFQAQKKESVLMPQSVQELSISLRAIQK